MDHEIKTEIAELRLRIARLRDRAEQCRVMAGFAVSDSAARELSSIAVAYERDAAELEQGARRT